MAAPEGVRLGVGVGLCSAAEGAGSGGLITGVGVALGVSWASDTAGVGEVVGVNGKPGVSDGVAAGPIAAAIN